MFSSPNSRTTGRPSVVSLVKPRGVLLEEPAKITEYRGHVKGVEGSEKLTTRIFAMS